MKQSLEQLRRRAAETAPAERSQLRVSDSEPQAKRMKLADGSFAAAYTVQLSTETRSTVIVVVEATREPNDSELLSAGMRQIQRRMERMPERIFADGGYATRSNVGWAHRRKIQLFAPWSPDGKRAASATKRAGTGADCRASACMEIQDGGALRCPEGQTLPLRGESKPHGLPTLLFEAPAAVCGKCPNQQQCCPRGEGQERQVRRVVESRAMRKYLERMDSEQGPDLPAAEPVWKVRPDANQGGERVDAVPRKGSRQGESGGHAVGAGVQRDAVDPAGLEQTN